MANETTFLFFRRSDYLVTFVFYREASGNLLYNFLSPREKTEARRGRARRKRVRHHGLQCLTPNVYLA